MPHFVLVKSNSTFILLVPATLEEVVIVDATTTSVTLRWFSITGEHNLLLITIATTNIFTFHGILKKDVQRCVLPFS